eukprot:scaffold32961_cov70-Cyclotella_meneghiniana.AAC.7
MGVTSFIRQHRYMKLGGEGRNEDCELRETPTTSSSASSYSGSSQASLETELPHELCEHQTIKTNSVKYLWKRLKEKAGLRRMNKCEGNSTTHNRIGIDVSPEQYLVNQKDLAPKQVKKEVPKQSHKGTILHQSRVQLKRRLKLLTITEDEEFDTGLHEC